MTSLALLAADPLSLLLLYLSSRDLSLIDRTCRRLHRLSRNLNCRRALPDGSYRRVVLKKTVSSGIFICPRINTRPERPRNYYA